MTHPAPRAGDLVRVAELTPEALAALVTGARASLAPWMEWAAREYTADSARDFLDLAARAWDEGAAFHYAIAPGGEPVGVCALEARIGPRGREIGYWLHPDHTGRGHASAAVRTLVALAGTLDDVDHVEIHHDAANHRSRAVAERSGFTLVDDADPRPVTAPAETGVGLVWRLALP